MLSLLLQIQATPSNLPFLYAALAVSWAIFFLYAFWISRRQGELKKEIRELREHLDHRES
jgi:CcmD family protein